MGAEARERRRKMVPMQTEGTAWDIAHGAVYLASDELRWVTGIHAADRRRPDQHPAAAALIRHRRLFRAVPSTPSSHE